MRITTIIFILGIFSIRKISSQLTTNRESSCIKSDSIVNGISVRCSGQLLFSDNFDGNTLDAFRWNTSSNYYLRDGKLHIPVDLSSGTDPVFVVTSKFSFLYGRIDIRAKIAKITRYGLGDFVFGFGKNSSDYKIYFGNVTDLHKDPDHLFIGGTRRHGFHIYTLIWHQNSFEYKCDGKKSFKSFYSANSNDSNERKISFEISKDYIDYESYKSEVIVDYIRVHSADKDDIMNPCEPTVTEVWQPSKNHPTLCKGDLIFQDDFNFFDEKKWLQEIQGPKVNKGEDFVLWDGQVQCNDHTLILKPILWTDYRPDLDIMSSSLNLTDRCTSLHDAAKDCELKAFGQFIMPPIVAPRITTRNSFSFKYGRIEVYAKFPKGDWIFPLILLEPLTEKYGKSRYDSGRIQIATARSNGFLESSNEQNIVGQTLYGSLILSNGYQKRSEFRIARTLGYLYGEEFHHYSMTWSPDKVEFFVDGESYGTLDRSFRDLAFNKNWMNGGAMAPFDDFFYITLGVSVGGFEHFVDNEMSGNYRKPWKNNDPKARLDFWQAKDKWYPSWERPELKLWFINVFAL